MQARLLGATVCLIVGAGLVPILGCKSNKTSDTAPAASTTAATSAPATAPGAALPEQDRGFADSRNGWGWSDRCWKNLGANQLANAKAECLEGLKLAPDGATGARPSLLYNLGLIEERSGNSAGARDLFTQSLTLRPNAEVSAALSRVGGTPVANPLPQQMVGGKGPAALTCCFHGHGESAWDCVEPAQCWTEQPQFEPNPNNTCDPRVPNPCHNANPVLPEQQRNTSSFACGTVRCAAGQRCCQGARMPCVPQAQFCNDDPENMNVEPYGDMCDTKTNEPCPLGKTCLQVKQGHGPLTMQGTCI